jgi:hypothetical protein
MLESINGSRPTVWRRFGQTTDGVRLSAGISGILIATTVVSIGCLVWLACSPEDTDASESPLAMALARQLDQGPKDFYGPYGGENPFVLIHAPLYYLVATLAALPLKYAGLDAVNSALVGGRSLSLLSFVATLFMIARLARIDGADRRAGWWAAGLFAASSVLGGLPVAVRPDSTAVMLQTGGVLLVSLVLTRPRPSRWAVPAAYALFGLALCVKQHCLASPAVGTVLLLTFRRQADVSLKSIGVGIILSLVIMLFVYGAEEIATGGWMSRSILIAASRVPQVHPGDWVYVRIISIGLMAQSTGLVALFGAAGLAAIGRTRGWLRQMHWGVGTALLALFAAYSSWDAFRPNVQIASAMVFADAAIVVLMLLPAALIDSRKVLGNRFDAMLWVFLAAELGVVMVLTRASTGAWFNYALQATVFACVLTGRAMGRALDGGSARPMLPVAIAMLLVPFQAVPRCVGMIVQRQLERDAKAVLFQHYGLDRAEFFFVERPGDNRVFGQRRLVFDDWLYPVFERSGLAEPRARWLRQSLGAGGPVTVIVFRSELPTDLGIRGPIQPLGYTPGLKVGPLYSWRRARPNRGSVP